MPVIFVPKCSPLFIDKLSMTLDVVDSEKQIVQESFNNFIGGHYGGKLWESTNYYFNKKVYIEGESILFQCAPKNPTQYWLRVEYNPSKVDPSEVAVIANIVLPGGYKELVEYGRITRIDIAFDCHFLSVADLYFQYPGQSISKNHLKAGAIQTAYLGGDQSVNQFVFYDKVAEIKAKNGKLGKPYKKEVPKHPVTRIEWRYCPNTLCTFKNLLSGTGNNFEKLSLSMITGQPKTPTNDIEAMVKLVVELSKYEGLQQALLAIPKYKRHEIKDTIMKLGMTDWWQPAELWKTFPTAINCIVNPSPYINPYVDAAIS